MGRSPFGPKVLILLVGLIGAARSRAQEERPGEVAAPGATRPNIVLVMSDDQGYGDLGCHGNPLIDTPRLDRLAAAGAVFDRFYVCPVCSPTRASLMTGRYHLRTRAIDTFRGRSMMDSGEITIAEVLHEAGYRTGIFGKWHLGDCYPLRPIDQGFDEALVLRGGGLAQPSEPLESEQRYTDPILFHNGAPVLTRGYCTDVYFDAALRFIDASVARGQPFFAYIPTNAPHTPLHDVPPALYEKYRKRDLRPVLLGNDQAKDRVARIYAMVENIDTNMGRLLDYLEAKGLTDRTLVIFLSDNGPQGRRYVGAMRGTKSEVYEGGIRSPLFVRWPGRIEPGRHVTPIAAHIDLFPTLVEAAGLDVPAGDAIDGRSLLPLLMGRPVAWPERLLFIQCHRGDWPVRGHNFAVISPRWKLLCASGFGRETPPDQTALELFNLPADPLESHDQAAAQPDVVARLRAAYDGWFDDVSTTRPDNFAPPRIVIGTAHEVTTVLTRQDWRAIGGGWGRQGVWRLQAPEECDFEITLLFTEEQALTGVTLDLGTRQRHLDLAARGRTIALGRQPLPAGAIDLMITCQTEAGERAPYQVVLRR